MGYGWGIDFWDAFDALRLGYRQSWSRGGTFRTEMFKGGYRGRKFGFLSRYTRNFGGTWGDKGGYKGGYRGVQNRVLGGSGGGQGGWGGSGGGQGGSGGILGVGGGFWVGGGSEGVLGVQNRVLGVGKSLPKNSGPRWEKAAPKPLETPKIPAFKWGFRKCGVSSYPSNRVKNPENGRKQHVN